MTDHDCHEAECCPGVTPDETCGHCPCCREADVDGLWTGSEEG